MTTDESSNGALPKNNESEQGNKPMELTGYCMKRKEKNVPILNAVLAKTAKGAFLAKGVDEFGNKMTTIVNAAKAAALVEAGIAKMEA